MIIFNCCLRMLFERIAGKGCFRSNWECPLAIILRGFLEMFLRESFAYLFQSFLKVLFSVAAWKDAWECCLCGFFEEMLWKYAFDDSFQRLFEMLLPIIIQSDFLNSVFHVFFKQSLSKYLLLFLRDCFERFGLNECCQELSQWNFLGWLSCYFWRIVLENVFRECCLRGFLKWMCLKIIWKYCLRMIFEKIT